jgi:hypothetical protein
MKKLPNSVLVLYILLAMNYLKYEPPTWSFLLELEKMDSEDLKGILAQFSAETEGLLK